VNLRTSSLTGLPATTLEILKGVSDLLARLPAIERSVSLASRHAQETLDEILVMLRPIEDELDDLRATADRLETQIGRFGAAVATLDGRADGLTERAARIEGALEHVLDRVPGLSAADASRRADEKI